MRRLLAAWLLGCALLLSAAASFAVEPGEMLEDPALEARAREIGREIRCLVCQNQSIDDSSADLARDLRIIVRERLVAGDSDDEVRQYLVDRYGDFVLLEPPVKPATYLLWFGPIVLFVGAAIGVVIHLRRRQRQALAVAPLSAAERRRLAELLAGDPPEGPT